ncbi:NIPSNAP family containing protein [Mucilaginibacter sp. PAMC 26640]|nr:NIPSNAP family containing protein [Mucilaginibacter sp. PAMC 26640]
MKIYAKMRSVLLLLFVLLTVSSMASAASGYYYQIKIYHFKNDVQEQAVDSYLKDSYLPVLHKLGVKNVGVFKPMATDTAKRTYVFIPFKSWKDLQDFDSKVVDAEDGAGKAYLDAAYNQAPYTRMETIVLSAFATRTSPVVPKLAAPKADRVYELRSYESPTEKLHYNKVKMFNSGETDLFDRINSNPVFYGSVVAGSHMPNLMYMTAYNSMADRDKHWDAFGSAPEWKALIAQDQYKNNVSRNDIVFLHPTDYSDF